MKKIKIYFFITNETALAQGMQTITYYFITEKTKGSLFILETI